MSAANPEHVPRLPIVGVLGSGTESHDDLALPLGHWLAREGVHLLTGGGGGVMAAVSRAFHETPHRRGLVIGVLPSAGEDPRAGTRGGYPNPWVEIPVVTHLQKRGSEGTDPLSRNHVNVLTSGVIVALPGGPGTASEVRLALEYGRPIIAFAGSRGAIDGLPGAVPWAEHLHEVQAFVRASLG